MRKDPRKNNREKREIEETEAKKKKMFLLFISKDNTEIC